MQDRLPIVFPCACLVSRVFCLPGGVIPLARGACTCIHGAPDTLHGEEHSSQPVGMAYFISNGALIGGGSLGRTEQLPTLKLLCVDLCARYGENGGNPTRRSLAALAALELRKQPIAGRRVYPL